MRKVVFFAIITAAALSTSSTANAQAMPADAKYCNEICRAKCRANPGSGTVEQCYVRWGYNNRTLGTQGADRLERQIRNQPGQSKSQQER